MEFFKSFKVSEPSFMTLEAGKHIVRLIKYEETNSFLKLSGETKDNLPEWIDHCPQLAVTVVTTEKGKSGGLTHRFNGQGYLKVSELTEDQLESGDYTDIGGYACITDDDGNYNRVPSEEHTKECANILNQFANALKIPVKTKLEKGLDEAIANKIEFEITVVNEPYEGKDQLRINRFKQIKAVVKADLDD